MGVKLSSQRIMSVDAIHDLRSLWQVRSQSRLHLLMRGIMPTARDHDYIPFSTAFCHID
jgi:hypothetical protein